MIDRRLVEGAWVRLAPSVYALASHPFTWERQAMAAVLSIPDAVLSGRAAAALHRIEGFRKGAVEVTVPPGGNSRSTLAPVRRSDFIRATTVDRIPTLTMVDTLSSLAGRVSAPMLERAVDHVLVATRIPLVRIEDRFVEFAAGRRRGTAAMRELLDVRNSGYVPATSELERLLRRMLLGPGLPEFSFEVEMCWWSAGQGRVDAYALGCTLIVEGDGRGWHTRERDFARDRERDNLAAANGHAVLRFTFGQLSSERDACRRLVRQTAEARGWKPPPGPIQ
jgi:very-short-patch-repair endonuclease